MKRTLRAFLAAVVMSGTGSLALAADAGTSATANNRGAAAATAQYTGENGFARTDTRSGPVNAARGVAVGLDDDGLSLSISNAVAPRNGPAVATNFNLSIGRDGDVSHSSGVSVARGPFEREVTAGGATGTMHSGVPTSSTAGGRTDPFGRVDAQTNAGSAHGLAPVFVRPPNVIEHREAVVRIRPTIVRPHPVVAPRRVIRISR